MQFEKQNTASHNLGKMIGKGASFFTFTFIAFFIAGKTGRLCWSLKNYFYFAASFAVIIFLLDYLARRLSGRGSKTIL